MTNLNEILSTVLDGECSPAELDQLLDASRRSTDLFRRFGRYCAQREASVGTRFDFDAEALCANVMSQIRPTRGARSIALRRQILALSKPLTGLALAASLGAMATIGLYRYADAPSSAGHSGSAAPRMSVVASAMPVVAGVNKIANRVQTSPVADEVRWTKLAPSTTRELDDYVIYDSAYRPSVQGMGSALTYARVTAQESAFSFPQGTPDGKH